MESQERKRTTLRIAKISFHFLCVFGAGYQIFELSSEYFKFEVRYEYRLEKQSTFTIPNVMLFHNLYDLINITKVEKSQNKIIKKLVEDIKNKTDLKSLSRQSNLEEISLKSYIYQRLIFEIPVNEWNHIIDKIDYGSYIYNTITHAKREFNFSKEEDLKFLTATRNIKKVDTIITSNSLNIFLRKIFNREIYVLEFKSNKKINGILITFQVTKSGSKNYEDGTTLRYPSIATF